MLCPRLISYYFFRQVITQGGVTYRNEPWHRECFTCTHCVKSLAGQRFTSRDDKPYCAECFGELFSKRCTACSKPITGKTTTIDQTFIRECKMLTCTIFTVTVGEIGFGLILIRGLRPTMRHLIHTPTLGGSPGVINAHGPSPQTTACSLSTATGSNQAQGNF